MYIKKFHVLRDEADSGEEGAAGTEESKAPVIDPKEYQALLESVKNLEEKNKALYTEKMTAKEKAEQAAMEAAKKSGDIETIEKSWMEKHQAAEKSKLELESNYQSIIKNITIEATASRLASELALPGSAEVLEPHIQKRLGLEIRDGKVHQYVLDKNGSRSAMTLKELQAEILSTPAFAPIINGTKAKGSGYSGSPWEGGDGAKVVTRDKFASMNERQKNEFIGKGGKVVDK